MTGPAADRTGAKALVRALRSLGAPRQAERALASGPQGHDLARAITEILAPAELMLLHPISAPTRARFRTTSDDFPAIARMEPDSRDLILVGGGLEAGELASVRDTIMASARLLRPRGVLAAVIDTLAAPISEGTGQSFNALLSPQLARQGAFGDTAQARAPLSAGAWMLLLQCAGFEVVAGLVAEQPKEFDRVIEEHSTRFSVYDRQELSQGRLHFLARKAGEPT